MQDEVFLGLGSNLGNREAYLENAIVLLHADKYVNVLKKSSAIQTDPMGDIVQPNFLNMVLEVETSLPPKELLALCLEIEFANGRMREEKWGPRTLDIDILFFGRELICEYGLEIPHPEVARRYFALAPMAEIAPQFEHPITEEPVWAMLQRL